MARIGYARVSSIGQSLAVQREKLRHCDKIYEEKKSGATATRPQLAACLDYVREGDALLVTRLDRLVRSTLHLCQIAAELARKGVHHAVRYWAQAYGRGTRAQGGASAGPDQQIDTSDATGRLLFNMLGAIAQFETELRAERQMDGIHNAKARGVAFGRRKALTPQRVTELQDARRQGALIHTLMHDFNVSKATVYRYLDGVSPDHAATAGQHP